MTRSMPTMKGKLFDGGIWERPVQPYSVKTKKVMTPHKTKRANTAIRCSHFQRRCPRRAHRVVTAPDRTTQRTGFEKPYILAIDSVAPAQRINITAVQPTSWITLRAAAK